MSRSDAIATVTGQGYRFALPVTKGDSEANRASISKHNLPYQLTSFVGREQEIAQLEELVTANRLVALTGAGGVGKTRLAMQVASQFIDGFPNGVWLVELAALSDPQLVPQAVAKALEVKEQPMRPFRSRRASGHEGRAARSRMAEDGGRESRVALAGVRVFADDSAMASSGTPERYRFGPFELQLDEQRLLRDGAVVPLRPRAFALLSVLDGGEPAFLAMPSRPGNEIGEVYANVRNGA